jgi:hypothetical protein
MAEQKILESSLAATDKKKDIFSCNNVLNYN